MKTAADAILFQLKGLGEAQAETLARRLGISVQAVRQRLERLLTDDLVCFSDRTSGRGRPRRLWSLAPGAAGLFPDTHAQLTVDLIGSIRRELGEPAFARLLQRRRDDITAAYRKRLAAIGQWKRSSRPWPNCGRRKATWRDWSGARARDSC